MCGIAGAVWNDASKAVEQQTLQRMIDVLRHRGPDDEGVFFSGQWAEGGGEKRGHAPRGAGASAAVDYRPSRQPISNEDGSVWVVFNGEIYNFRELRRRLEQSGHRFRTQSDTGVRSHHCQLQEERRVAGADLDVEERLKEAVEQKLEETRHACRILGFEDIRDLGFEDDDTLVTQDKIEAITEAIREVKPDILITHQPYEIGGLISHATIGQATIHAWQRAMGVGHGRQERHYVPLIYFMNPRAFTGYSSLGYAGTSGADVYVDITDVIDKKVQALDYISSQYYSGSYSRKRAETEDGAHGQRTSVAYAEQFQSFFPMRRYTLPITDSDLDLIDESHEVLMGRRGEMIGGLMPMPPGMAFTSQYRVPKEKYSE